MKKVALGLLVFMILISIFSACTRENQSSVQVNMVSEVNKVYFTEPDKILVYQNGNAQIINKDNKLFSEITKLINERVDNRISTYRLGFDEYRMSTTKEKELVIEFAYSKDQKSKFENVERQYNNLIFPLTGEYKEFCFFDNGKKDYSGPLGKLKHSAGLLKLLN